MGDPDLNRCVGDTVQFHVTPLLWYHQTVVVWHLCVVYDVLELVIISLLWYDRVTDNIDMLIHCLRNVSQGQGCL